MDNCLEVKEHAIKKDGEVSACLILREKPVSSQEYTCKEHFLGGKEHAIKEDGKVRASSLLSKKPVSSEENTCKEH
eukprot:5086212-Ditylum_brightwellii.AAC.1